MSLPAQSGGHSKTCKKCQRDLPLCAFYQTGTGYVRPSCKDCERKQVASYRETNREKTRAYSREWWRRNSETRTVHEKQYRENNREIIAQKAKAYWSKPENRERKARMQRERFAGASRTRATPGPRQRSGVGQGTVNYLRRGLALW